MKVAFPLEMPTLTGEALHLRATAAARLVLAYAAEYLALTEIQAEVRDRNHASRHLFARLAFKSDKVFCFFLFTKRRRFLT